MEHSLHHKVKAVSAMDSNTINSATTTDGNAIDTLGYESLEYIVQTGTVTTAGTVSVLLEESDTSFTGETTVPAEENLGGANVVIVAADDDKVFRCGSIGKKRYQRIAIVTAGTNNFIVAIVGVLGHPKNAAVAEQVT